VVAKSIPPSGCWSRYRTWWNLSLVPVRAAVSGPVRRHRSPTPIRQEGWAGLYLIRCGYGNREIKGRSEAATYKQFKGVIDQILEVNQQICEVRPVSSPAKTGGFLPRVRLADIEAVFSSSTEGSRPIARSTGLPPRPKPGGSRAGPPALRSCPDGAFAPASIPWPRVRESGHG
jgi:hypothetical protein